MVGAGAKNVWEPTTDILICIQDFGYMYMLYKEITATIALFGIHSIRSLLSFHEVSQMVIMR